MIRSRLSVLRVHRDRAFGFRRNFAHSSMNWRQVTIGIEPWDVARLPVLVAMILASEFIDESLVIVKPPALDRSMLGG
jgi:hypothetical protein